MPIKVDTVYTKERLLRFNRYAVGNKKFFWIFMAVCTFVVAVALGVVAALDALDTTMWTYAILLVFVDLFYLFFYLVLPRFTVKKAQNLDTVICYEFEEESVRIHAQNKFVDEELTVKYPMISKIGRKDNDVYLFNRANQAYIVDISQLSGKDTVLLKTTLEQIVPSKKFNWK